MVFSIAAIALASAYLLLTLYYVYHWWREPAFIVPEDFHPSTPLTIIIVAHNEEKHIGKCVEHILNQHYPAGLVDMIIVNDRSTDHTREMIERINARQLTLLHLEDHPDFIHASAYKKSGIELAVHHSKHDWIVTTDADCTPSTDWLRTIAFKKEISGAFFLAAPIQLNDGESLLVKMQQWENLSFMLITAAGIRSGIHDLANGANMSFSKSAFIQINGYEGNYQYPSGDDMFLIEKMRIRFPDKISFVKSLSGLVMTAPKKDWISLIKQRIRWAGKNKGLKNPVIHIIWSFIGIYHVSLILLFILALFFNLSWWPFLITLMTKWIADFVILSEASHFFNKRNLFVHFIPLQLLYMFYMLRLGWNLLLRRQGDWEGENVNTD